LVDKLPADAATLAVLGEAYMPIYSRPKAGPRLAAVPESCRSGSREPSHQDADWRIGDRSGSRRARLRHVGTSVRYRRGCTDCRTGSRDQGTTGATFRQGAEVAASLIKRDTNNPIYHSLLGVVRVAQQDYSGAESAFRAALAINPDLTADILVLAQVYAATGRTEEARNLYNDLLAKDPNEVVALLGLADTDIAQQKWAEAIDAINRARTAAPNDSAPGLKLISVYEMRGDWTSAKALAAELAAQFPGNANILDTQGQAQLAAGDTNGAVSSFKRAHALAPSSAPVLSHYLAAPRNISPRPTGCCRKPSRATRRTPP